MASNLVEAGSLLTMKPNDPITKSHQAYYTLILHFRRNIRAQFSHSTSVENDRKSTKYFIHLNICRSAQTLYSTVQIWHQWLCSTFGAGTKKVKLSWASSLGPTTSQTGKWSPGRRQLHGIGVLCEFEEFNAECDRSLLSTMQNWWSSRNVWCTAKTSPNSLTT